MSEEMLYNKTGIKQRVIQEIIELAFLEVRGMILFWMLMKRHQLFLNLML